ncbi:hypothetical protein JN11_01047 [Mucilaginibacter frigoritolerans]|uniref:Lipocalin-like protein n=2 Tax=Mucilaginibacter frigoritolerans TaxID=652788 RepID=A0A562UE14_9SPHI|nr:hypothetical protein JN11_01047 [Mucilaginibacter frigoritolerans]
MKPKGLFFILLLSLAVGGCKKDKKENVVFDGNYSGWFFLSNKSGVALKDSVVILMQSGQFSSLTSSSTLTTGKGTYLINGGTATFTNMEAFPDNLSVVTTAVLNGSYTYAIKGDSLLLIKTDASQNIYTYKLAK